MKTVLDRCGRRAHVIAMDNSNNASIAILPDIVRLRLSDEACATDNTAIELVVSTAGGWPAVAHLSVGELLLGSDGLLRMAVWRESRTGAALAEQRRGVLLFAGPDQLLEIRFCVLVDALLETSKALVGFLLAPVELRDKRAAYATVTSGLQFELHDAASVRVEWRRAREALAELFPPSALKEAST
jgi:hypothetical protein